VRVYVCVCVRVKETGASERVFERESERGAVELECTDVHVGERKSVCMVYVCMLMCVFVCVCVCVCKYVYACV